MIITFYNLFSFSPEGARSLKLEVVRMATSERGTRPWLFLVVGVETWRWRDKRPRFGRWCGDAHMPDVVVSRRPRRGFDGDGGDNISYELQPAEELDDYRSATRPAHQCAWSGGINDHWICFYISVVYWDTNFFDTNRCPWVAKRTSIFSRQQEYGKQILVKINRQILEPPHLRSAEFNNPKTKDYIITVKSRLVGSNMI